MFHNTQIIAGSIFEWTTLLTMAVYWIIATVSTPEAAVKLNKQE